MEHTEVHWTELFGNPLRHSLHPAMLTPEGYRLRLVTVLKGKSKKQQFAVTVVFDESYVVAKLTKLLQELQPQSYNDFQKIASKSWMDFNAKKKENN